MSGTKLPASEWLKHTNINCTVHASSCSKSADAPSPEKTDDNNPPFVNLFNHHLQVKAEGEADSKEPSAFLEEIPEHTKSSVQGIPMDLEMSVETNLRSWMQKKLPSVSLLGLLK